MTRQVTHTKCCAVNNAGAESYVGQAVQSVCGQILRFRSKLLGHKLRVPCIGMSSHVGSIGQAQMSSASIDEHHHHHHPTGTYFDSDRSHEIQPTSAMLLLGLTGSIATGKSTVSSILSAPPYDLPIIDADKVARQVVEPGTAGYQKIVEQFLPSTPDLLLPATAENGGEHGVHSKGRPLNRPALGRRVFAQGSDADRKTLNKIVHPAVRAEMYKQMLLAYLKGSWCVVLDVPLLFESGWEPLCGVIMVVAVKDAAVQKARLRGRDKHLTEEDANNRIAAQLDVREKARRSLRRGPKAGVVLWNDGGLEDLKAQIAVAMKDIKSQSPQWWALLLLLCPPLAAASGLLSFIRSWNITRQLKIEDSQAKPKL